MAQKENLFTVGAASPAGTPGKSGRRGGKQSGRSRLQASAGTSRSTNQAVPSPPRPDEAQRAFFASLTEEQRALLAAAGGLPSAALPAAPAPPLVTSIFTYGLD